MYNYFAKAVKYIVKILRVIQIAATVYFVIFPFYWGAQIFKGGLEYILEGMYTVPINATKSILEAINWTPSPDFELFHPLTFYSIIFLLIVLVLYNVIFIPLGSIEKFFVEKSYDKGENDY